MKSNVIDPKTTTRAAAYYNIENYYISNRHSSSTTEIVEAVGIARGTAYKYLVDMSARGMIRYDGQQIVTEKTGDAGRLQVQRDLFPLRENHGGDCQKRQGNCL